MFLAQRLAPGKRVLAELPTYDRPLKILRELGAEIVELLACDDEGLDPDALEQALRAGPSARVPLPDPDLPEPERPHAEPWSGAGGSSSSRSEHDLLVLEDDPYGLVRYEGEPLPSLFELSGGRRRLQLVVLEDDRAGPARRLVRVPGAARARDRGDAPRRPTSRRCCSARRR